uniref:Peptidase S1 domain-containing protein n=1 Tax=Anopheles culicifacies TaxID=139723 RepID=A0A182M2G3_9DIPT
MCTPRTEFTVELEKMATKLCVLVLLLGGVLANEPSALNGTAVDWSNVRFVDELDEYWARLPEEFQQFRNTLSGPTSRISNGYTALPGQFPYQVVLLSEFTIGTVFCGATVLTNSYLLTTAHCVMENGVLKANGGLAIMGTHDRTIVEATQQRISTAMSRLLRYAFDDIISNADCTLYWSPLYVDEQNLCMLAANGRSPCIGDSGGPLMVNSASGPIQVGIVSFGEAVGCAVNYPSIYARITHFLPWILDNSDY